MITLSNAVAPTILPVGLQLNIGQCSFYINSSLIASPPTNIVLPANLTSYVYLNMASGTIGVASAGFPLIGAVPIAIATTSNSSVISLIDQRPDFIANTTTPTNSVVVTSTNVILSSPGVATTYVFATGGTAGITVGLPSAAISIGGAIVIKKVDSALGAVNVTPSNSQTVEGQPSFLLTNQYQYIGCGSDGANWNVTVNN